MALLCTPVCHAADRILQDGILAQWRRLRDDFGSELHRLDSLGEDYNNNRVCLSCLVAHEVIYQCIECLYGTVVCQECLVESHQRLPFHVVKVSLADLLVRHRQYTNFFGQVRRQGHWQQASLYDAGLRVNLGHPAGQICPRFKPGPSTFTIINSNGLHRVHLNFCHCPDRVLEPWRQLIHLRWWPATTADPHTAITFECLRQFEKLNASGHINATDYYRGLAVMTDPFGLNGSPVRVTVLSLFYR
jgi:hypothetical protein